MASISQETFFFAGCTPRSVLDASDASQEVAEDGELLMESEGEAEEREPPTTKECAIGPDIAPKPTAPLGVSF